MIEGLTPIPASSEIKTLVFVGEFERVRARCMVPKKSAGVSRNAASPVDGITENNWLHPVSNMQSVLQRYSDLEDHQYSVVIISTAWMSSIAQLATHEIPESGADAGAELATVATTKDMQHEQP